MEGLGITDMKGRERPKEAHHPFDLGSVSAHLDEVSAFDHRPSVWQQNPPTEASEAAVTIDSACEQNLEAGESPMKTSDVPKQRVEGAYVR
jgi:hypothetical protein